MTDILFFVLAAFFISAWIKGVTGMGFATICVGILAGFLDLITAIPLVLIPSLLSNMLVMVDAGGFLAILRRFWLMYMISIPGSVIGLKLLSSAENAIPTVVLGFVLIFYGLWALGQASSRIPVRMEAWLNAPVGFLSGFISGTTGSQLMPVMPYLFALRLSRESYLQALNTSFTVSSLVMLVGLGNLGLLSVSTLLTSILGILPVTFGIWLGSSFRRAIPELLFRRTVLGFLIFLGIGLIMKA